MTNSEMVERIVKKSGITREQAEEALEKNNNDLLDAMIYVERTYSSGRTDDSSHYSTYEREPSGADYSQAPHSGFTGFDYSKSAAEDKGFEEAVKSCMKTAVKNGISVSYKGKEVFSLPLLIWIIAFFSSASTLFWVMIISMFFDVRYHVKGVTFNSEKANVFMDKVYGFVNSIKNSFTA